MIQKQQKFSDYIIYVDESGDHSLDSIDRHYPIFVLAFCIVEKEAYSDLILPQLKRLKFDFWGHDMTVLHEHEIRKSKNDFNILRRKEIRESFFQQLTDFMQNSPYTVIANAILKEKLNDKNRLSNPYHWALQSCLERAYHFLQEKGQLHKQTHVIAEARGNKEDKELELEFRRLCDKNQGWGETFKLRIAHKQVNSCGLQLADLLARPIGLSQLRPEQKNRTHAIIKSKYYKNGVGADQKYGLAIYPSEKNSA